MKGDNEGIDHTHKHAHTPACANFVLGLCMACYFYFNLLGFPIFLNYLVLLTLKMNYCIINIINVYYIRL